MGKIANVLFKITTLSLAVFVITSVDTFLLIGAVGIIFLFVTTLINPKVIAGNKK